MKTGVATSGARSTVTPVAASAVFVQEPQAIVLVAFSNDGARPQGDATDAGLIRLADPNATLQVYEGLFPRGLTSTFGPFFQVVSPDRACWATLTVVIPPATP